MTDSTPNNKRKKQLQVTSNFTSQTDHFYERVQDNNTGEVSVLEGVDSPQISSETKIKTNPYKHISRIGTSESSQAAIIAELSESKPGLDTSLL
jgi:hypothetical protein